MSDPRVLEAFVEGPFPVEVGLLVEAAPSPSADRLSTRLGKARVSRAIQDALGSAPSVVSKARVLLVDSREEAIRLSQTKGVDVLLAVSLESRGEYREYERPAGWATLEIVSWLLGGVPSWFVPTVSYKTDSTLTVEALDMGQRRVLDRCVRGNDRRVLEADPIEFDGRESFRSPDHRTSLWDRSHPFDRPVDYVLTAFAPPMVQVPGDPARLVSCVDDEILEDLSQQLREALRRRLLDAEASAPLSFAFFEPAPGSVVTSKDVRLTLAMARRGSTEIRALDIHRLSPKARPFRWKASSPDLLAISRRLGVAAGGPTADSSYLPVDLPATIPLEEGENFIKVRFLLDSGSLVTRTARYLRSSRE